jgi:hypothetical protein
MEDMARRSLLKGLIPASLALHAALEGTTARAATGAGQTHLGLKLVSDLAGRTTYAVTRGDVWGFKPQADDLTTEAFAKRLYGYWSLVARQARKGPDGSARLTTQGWTFYLDPETGETVTHIANPYTGETVPCPPLSGPARTAAFPPTPTVQASDPDLREQRLGEHAWIEVTRISRFKPADTTWFKLEADITTHACRVADLDDHDASFIPNTWSHNLVAEWQTWMKMHGTPGHILFRGAGAFIDGPTQTPAALARAMTEHFPGQLAAIAGWGR